MRQVDVTGLVAAAFTHRDSRAGDPDLHTHVAVANKVRTVGSGKWLSIDARVLYRGVVAASETYNTALTKLLEREGLRFTDRASRSGRRPVREIAGVAAELNERWSSRRTDIEVRRADLVAAFQADHGRPPSVVESVKLAQQATLETRDAKHEPRSLAEQRAVWHRQAVETLGSEGALIRMLDRTLGATGRPDLQRADAAWFEAAADRIVEVMEARAATWQDHHLRAEALRMVRRTDIPFDRVDAAVNLLVATAADRSIRLARPRPGHHRTRTAAPRRRHFGVHGRRGRPVHLRPGGGGRTATGRVGRPHRRPRHRTRARGCRPGGQRRRRAES